MIEQEYKKILAALDLLGVRKGATLADIKKKYYRLARKYHPDVSAEQDKQTCGKEFSGISEAYKHLAAYCKRYGPVPSRKEIRKNLMGEDYYNHIKRFYDGWWGDLDL